MSQIKLENLSGLVPMETVLPEAGKVRSQAAGAQSFDDHLWRVRAQSGETTAGGRFGSAALSPLQAAPADAARQPDAEREPAADHRRGEPQDSAKVDADDNVTGQVSPDQQPSDAAEAGVQAAQEQKTETDSDEDGAEQPDSRQAPGKPASKQLDGHLAKGNVGQQAPDSTSGGQEGAKDKAAQGTHTPQHASEGNAAAGTGTVLPNTEATEKTVGQETDDAGGKTTDQTLELIGTTVEATAATGRNRPDEGGDRADEASGQQRDSQIQVSQAGTGVRAERQGDSETASDDQAGQQPRKQPARKPAAAAAASSQAGAEVVSTEPAPSAAERTDAAGDQKAHLAQETAKPAATAAPEGRLNVPLRLSPSQETRAESAQQPQNASESGQVDQARFVRRVARAFRAIGKRGGSVRLRLSPPQLGSLRLEIAVRNGLMTARVEAETSTARNLLLDNLPALRDRLAQQDIKVKQFDVDLMDRSPGGLPDQTADHTQSHHRGGGNAAPQSSGNGDAEANTISDPGAANRPGEGTQLNVVI